MMQRHTITGEERRLLGESESSGHRVGGLLAVVNLCY